MGLFTVKWYKKRFRRKGIGDMEKVQNKGTAPNIISPQPHRDADETTNL